MLLLVRFWERLLDSQVLQTPFGQIKYRIEKKPKNRHTYLRIKEGFVEIKANAFICEKEIKTLLLKNAREIITQLKTDKKHYLFGEELGAPDDIESFYKQKAKEFLPQRVKTLAKHCQLFPTRVTITKAKSRWGSCSGKNSISLSCFLVKLPFEVIDYVIIHELCHIKHKNHSKTFWQEVKNHCPEYKQMVRILREYEKKAL